ncbi:MAG: hypothetical protein MHPSP_004278, partial [Paramarteilia canceri]
PLKYQTKQGTGPLQRHREVWCSAKEESLNLTKIVNSPAVKVVNPKISNEWAEKVCNAAIFKVCSGLNSFKSIEDPGLINFVQLMMDFARLHPGIPASEIMPNRRKISKEMPKLAAMLKDSLINDLKFPVQFKYLAFSAGMWSCSKWQCYIFQKNMIFII